MNTTLFRPVGLAEMTLIFDAGLLSFPPRLPEQPIFYPVLNRDYAVQIARDWNAPTRQCGFAGYVTEFSVERTYADRFPIRTVGGAVHQELWVPAEELTEFNRRITGAISVSDTFFGAGYTGSIPQAGPLARRPAVEQLQLLADLADQALGEVVAASPQAIYLNYPFWASQHTDAPELQGADCDELTDRIRIRWQARFPATPLPPRGSLRPQSA